MSHPLYQVPEEQAETEEKPKPRGVRLRLPGVLEQPYLTYALIAINVILYALKYLAPDFYMEHILYAGFSYTDGIVKDNEFYRIFTAMFLHASEAHLLFNMFALYSIGGYVERYFGRLRFLLIYFLGGALGGLLMLFVSEAGLGASGAIFAIFGAQIVFLYLHRELFGAGGRAAMWSSIRVMALNFAIGFIANATAELAGGNGIIGNAAHIGGALGGAILAWFIAPRFHVRVHEFPREGELPIQVEQTNRLKEQLIPLVTYGIALVTILYFALRLLA